ncbi:MAG: hypothetical protein NZM09_02355 [Ignavibacterium sp.]|nr:hypothetical protein [Ignavibacterium sp.]MDW8374518.1 hypothetical protein [Ignavibacteriales bacterium]
MIEFIKEKIAYYIIKKYLKKKKYNSNLTFTESFSNSFDFLIIMPTDESDFRNSFQVIEFIENHNKTILIFLNDFKVALLPIKFRNKTFSFNLNDINKLNLPKKELIDKLIKLKFDMVIDLNRIDSLFHSYVANLVGAKFRIGMNKKKAAEFYNVIFSDHSNESSIFYSNFVSFIKMF